MQVKTNIRAGKKGADDTTPQGPETPVYVPPVSRCAGI